jgi:hypothetical protein
MKIWVRGEINTPTNGEEDMDVFPSGVTNILV